MRTMCSNSTKATRKINAVHEALIKSSNIHIYIYIVNYWDAHFFKISAAAFKFSSFFIKQYRT